MEMSGDSDRSSDDQKQAVVGGQLDPMDAIFKVLKNSGLDVTSSEVIRLCDFIRIFMKRVMKEGIESFNKQLDELKSNVLSKIDQFCQSLDGIESGEYLFEKCTQLKNKIENLETDRAMLCDKDSDDQEYNLRVVQMTAILGSQLFCVATDMAHAIKDGIESADKQLGELKPNLLSEIDQFNEWLDSKGGKDPAEEGGEMVKKLGKISSVLHTADGLILYQDQLHAMLTMASKGSENTAGADLLDSAININTGENGEDADSCVSSLSSWTIDARDLTSIMEGCQRELAKDSYDTIQMRKEEFTVVKEKILDISMRFNALSL